jgi:hypothetical protein
MLQEASRPEPLERELLDRAGKPGLVPLEFHRHEFLAWEDGEGKCWLAYNSAAYLKDRHALTGQDEQMKRIDALMEKLAAGVAAQ